MDDEGRVVGIYSRSDITFLATAADPEAVLRVSGPLPMARAPCLPELRMSFVSRIRARGRWHLCGQSR